MIPLRDSNPSGTIPAVTIALIAVNCLVWFYEVSLGEHAQGFIVEYGLIPLRFVKFYQYQGGFMDNAAVPLFASIFMHGGWLHVIGNMWFLWIFGDNVEDRLGHVKFLLFYLLVRHRSIPDSCDVQRGLTIAHSWGERRHLRSIGGLSHKLPARACNHPSDNNLLYQDR